MINPPGTPMVSSVDELFAIAYQIEVDAGDRYTVLAAQMEVHNNPDLAALFRDLARAEGLHAAVIARKSGSAVITTEAYRLGRWLQGESPEAADVQSAHYLMTPRDALTMALAAEQRAVAFFTQVVETATDPALKTLAAELLEEEVAHVNLCQRLLQRYPVHAGERPTEDADPPQAQD